VHFTAKILQLLNHVGYLAVAQVGAVFFEGKAQHYDFGTLDIGAVSNHLLDSLLPYIGGHAIVDATAGQNDLRVVA